MHTGGWADKLGNRYEGRWIAKQLLRLLDGKVSAVKLESLNEDHVDVSVVNLDGTTEFHQCKRTVGSKVWTIPQLKKRGVLGPLRTHLTAHVQNRFVFVSNQRAAVIRIAELSHQFMDLSAFLNAIQASTEDTDLWTKWCESIQCIDSAAAFDFLRRTDLVLLGDGHRELQDLCEFASFVLLGDARDVILRLADYAIGHMSEWIHADTLRAFIERETTFEIRELANSDILESVFERCRAEYKQSIAPYLVNGGLISRPEARSLLQSIAAGSKRFHILHGASGQGKSCVLYDLMTLLEGAGIPVFCVRFDVHVPRLTTREFGSSLGLPESPVRCMQALAGNRRSVIILDQLDALHWSLQHDPTSWTVFLQLMNEVFQANVAIHAVVACRTFDLQNDANIKAWRNDKDRGPGIEEVPIADLPEASVQALVESDGQQWSGLSKGQRQLLCKPLHLYVWCQRQNGGPGAWDFRTSTDLLRGFWDDIRNRLLKKGCMASDIKTAVEKLVGRMDRDGKLTAPESTMEHWPSVRNGLLSLDVLTRADGKLRFVHQSYLDFALAMVWRDKLRDEGKTVSDWLHTDDEQSLLRRGQLRQLLALIRDDEPDAFADSIRAILQSNTIRFHLRHLTLQFLSSVTDPTAEETSVVLECLRNPRWREAVISQVIVLRPQWFRTLDATGLWEEWLLGPEQWQPNSACWVFRTVVDTEGERIFRLLERFVGEPEPWRTRVWNVLPRSPGKDSDRAFELRLRLVQDGISRQFAFLFDEEFAKHSSRRVIQLFTEIVRASANDSAAPEAEPRRESWPHWLPRHSAVALLYAAEEEPLLAWESLLPLLLTAIEKHPVQEPRWDEQSFQADALWNDHLYRFNHNGAEPLPTILAKAGGHWLRMAYDDAVTALRFLYGDESRSVQQIIGTTWFLGPDDGADEAIGWLLNDTRRFDLAAIGRERKRVLARQLIARFAPLCSDGIYNRLEAALLSYYPQREIADAKFRIKIYRQGERWYSANLYGFSQHALLQELPEKRRSLLVMNKIGQLRQKYGKPADEIEGDRDPIARVVSSSMSSHSAKLSDAAWLNLMEKKHDTAKRRHSFRRGLESSPEMFAHDLALQADRNPGRFASLALKAARDMNSEYWPPLIRALRLISSPDEKLVNWEPATDEQCKAVLERVGYDADREIGIAFCSSIAERPEIGVATNIMKVLSRYATEHPDPALDGCVLPNDSEDRLETEAINTVRALAAGGIASMLYLNSSHLSEFLSAIRALIVDSVACVRTAAIRAIIPVLNADRDLAVTLFLEAVRDTNEEILRTFHSRRFLGCVIKTHRARVQPLIQGMAFSASDSVAKDGAAWIAVVRLLTGEHASAFQQCASGSPPQRRGVAETLSQHLDDEEFAPACRELLPPFFDDDDADVRRAASGVLRTETDWSKAANASLLERYFRSRTFLDDVTFSLWSLEEFKGNLVVLSNAVFAACDTCSTAAIDPAFADGHDLDHAFAALSNLLLRLYGHTAQEDRALRKKCLDRWDGILQNARWLSPATLQSLDAWMLEG